MRVETATTAVTAGGTALPAIWLSTLICRFLSCDWKWCFPPSFALSNGDNQIFFPGFDSSNYAAPRPASLRPATALTGGNNWNKIYSSNSTKYIHIINQMHFDNQTSSYNQLKCIFMIQLATATKSENNLQNWDKNNLPNLLLNLTKKIYSVIKFNKV